MQVRHDLQGSYITKFGTVPYLTDLKPYGTSIEADIGYKKLFKKGWFILPSIGYYKFSVDKIINKSISATPLGTLNNRFSDYHPDSTPVGYLTKKYHYNNLSLGVAVGKGFILNSKYQLITDMAFNYLLNYSQKYAVRQATYSTNVKKEFGYLVTGRIGVDRSFQNFYLGSSLLLPIYKQLKKDITLYENPNEVMKNWFGGYGILFKVGKYFK